MPAEAGAEPLPPRALEPSTARVADARDLERPATSPGEVPVETPIVETPANPALPTEAEAGSTPAPPANPAEEASGTDELPPLPGSIVPPDAVAPGRADGAETQGGSELDDLPPLPEEATGAAGLTRRVEGRPRIELVTPEHTTLQPETLREVMDIARQQEEADRARIRQDPTERLPFMSEELDATQTQTDQLTRAPSPTEARPIRPIAVPEDFVPIDQRRWSPTRKYWAAAATCHTPLYFQDAVLERYGQGVEQALGPHWGRFFSYPLDDPRESVQRNQVLQPFYSTGKLALQIVAWPYNLIMDPPWESHYDLGYYRPGDQIPPDMTYLPHTGLGPPLRGAKY
jgi:hypothetical protein